MYVIIAYDVNVERVNKVKAYLRTKLTWVQNSLFEGEITEATLLKIKNDLNQIIDEEADSVVIYVFRDKAYISRENMGIIKGSPDEVVI
ncbi:MAG: CRISPR-associated endonuclease Cas2 [Candidatus Micrarchaeota archaeon]|nr:CRISPR-associated endonuclease Cas2 [Candidatus Micrarchaeota archaeon]